MGLLWSGIIQWTSRKYVSALCLGQCATARSWKWRFPNLRSAHQWGPEAGTLQTVEAHSERRCWNMVLTQTQILLNLNGCLDQFGFFPAHYWNVKAIHGREIWWWTSLVCVVCFKQCLGSGSCLGETSLLHSDFHFVVQTALSSSLFPVCFEVLQSLFLLFQPQQSA